MSEHPRDFLARARAWAGTGLFLAGGSMILGSSLDWVTIERFPERIPADQQANAQPFNGFEVGDGYWTAGAGIVLVVGAVLLVLRARHAWVGFVGAIVGGAVAISDYRSIDALFERSSAIGSGIQPGIGLTLVAVGALLGLVSSVVAKAATPRTG